MKVTTKGQITIPKKIRQQLNFHPGTEVDFVVEGNAVIIVPSKQANDRSKRIIARMRGIGSANMTTDEIMALTRGEG